MTQKPKFCTLPDCFSCPYADCRYSQMTLDEYLAQKQRDREFAEDPDRVLPEYKQRSDADDGRKAYFRAYYQKNRARLLQYKKDRSRVKPQIRNDDRREYYKQYYREHKDKKHQYYMEHRDELKEWRKLYRASKKEQETQH